MPKEFKGCPTDRSGVGIFMALEAAILMGVSANGPKRIFGKAQWACANASRADIQCEGRRRQLL